MTRLPLVLVLALPLPLGCQRPAAPDTGVARAASAPAAAVLPGGGSANNAAWYDDRRDSESEVVAGPPVATDSASVTRTHGGLNVTASGEVRDTLDRRTYRETVRTTD